MQKVFDVENKEDMDLLWSILPIGIIKVCKKAKVNTFWSELFYQDIPSGFININWHDKKEITRPIQEATEQDIGKLCRFWDNDGTIAYGLLSDFIIEESEDRKYGCVYGRRWTHARRLTKQDIEELC